MEHRNEAQAKAGLTDAQLVALSMGRKPGNNNRTGYEHREESKRKTSVTHKAWCAANPDKVKARGMKTQGTKHYNWKGGCTRLNASIRRMTENRKWLDAVKARDGKCLVCETIESLESHHIIPLAVMVGVHNITNRDEARECAALWDLSNGMTVCARCHYKIHGRKYED
jgi:5-methylcytosine-specific restriction endonuclease McrA